MMWLLMIDARVNGQFDVLCQYLGLPTSLSVLFSQSDVLRHLVPRSAAFFIKYTFYASCIT